MLPSAENLETKTGGTPLQSNFIAIPSMKTTQKSTHLKQICLIQAGFLIVSLFVLGMLSTKVMILVQENERLATENVILRVQKGFLPWAPYGNYSKGDSEVKDTEKLAKLIDIRECPPCTTPPPIIVNPENNPVSIINEEFTGDTEYDCNLVCLNPPISEATLRINEDPHVGKEWHGRGKKKSLAKQDAAYKAIQDIAPHLIDQVEDEYIPPEYNPTCKTPNSRRTISQKSEC